MCYNAMTMTVMGILNSCSSLMEKQDYRYDQSKMQSEGAPCAHGKRNKHARSRDDWDIDMELVSTRFLGSMIFHKWR
jgi:hypothetical protein